MTKSSEIRILNYRPELRPHFENLNREWIEKYFEIEPHDLKVFATPEREVLEKGGEILFAELDGQIVGTGALTHDLGFTIIFRGQHPKYKRVDLVMEKISHLLN
jgi:hypothetical protein